MNEVWRLPFEVCIYIYMYRDIDHYSLNLSSEDLGSIHQSSGHFMFFVRGNSVPDHVRPHTAVAPSSLGRNAGLPGNP